jgi:hypothetical protein
VLLIKSDGTKLGRLVGYGDPKTFWANFKPALTGKPPFAPGKSRSPTTGTNDPELRMNYAYTLARNGQYPEALAEYLWCFDHGAEVRASFYWVRLSILLVCIKELGNHYPAAEKALEIRRDERQAELLAGTTDQPMVIEIVYLNGVLDQKDKNIAVFDRLPHLKSRSGCCFQTDHLSAVGRWTFPRYFGRLGRESRVCPVGQYVSGDV